MRIKGEQIDYDNTDLEKLKEIDKLNRFQYVENLSILLENIEDSFVLGLDAAWGYGKTFFVQMWKKHLEENDFPALYFNAWENDFSEDPFIAFISEISQLMKDDNEDKRKFLEKAKKLGWSITKAGIPALLKMLSYGAIDTKELEDKQLEKVFSDYVSDIAKDQIQSYEDSKNALSEFKKELEKFVVKLNSIKPLVIFVDELDRCRPDYAVRLLERIKHLFNVEGIIFVISYHKRQIKESIKALYGSNMDADIYLRRFIDQDFILPEPDLESFVESLFNKYHIDELIINRKNYFDRDFIIKLLNENTTKCFSYFSRLFDFSLRDIDQCYSQFKLYTQVTDKKFHHHSTFIIFLILLKKHDIALFNQFKSLEVQPLNILNYISTLSNRTFEKQGNLYEILLKYILSVSICFDELELFYSYLKNYTGFRQVNPYEYHLFGLMEDKESFKDYFIQNSKIHPFENFFNDTVQKLDLLDKFDVLK